MAHLKLVVGQIGGRVGVVVAAVGVDEGAIVGDIGIFFGAEKEHVLQKVSEAGVFKGVVNLANADRERRTRLVEIGI